VKLTNYKKIVMETECVGRKGQGREYEYGKKGRAVVVDAADMARYKKHKV